METNFITQVLFSSALFIIMLGMGLTLTIQDFARTIQLPKAIAIGLLLKLLLVPILIFNLIGLSGLPAELAMGFVIIASMPGGATTNLFTHLAKGDVALSITLTAIASIITVFTIPFVVQLGYFYFMKEHTDFSLPVAKTMAQIVFLTIIPVALGMYINFRRPKFSKKADAPFKMISTLVFGGLVFFAAYKERVTLLEHFKGVGLLSIVIIVLSLSISYALGYWITRSKKQALTISIENGVVNGTLGIAIASSILKSFVMSIPVALYSLLLFPFVFVLILVGIRVNK